MKIWITIIDLFTGYQNAKIDKPFTLNAHVRERLESIYEINNNLKFRKVIFL